MYCSPPLRSKEKLSDSAGSGGVGSDEPAPGRAPQAVRPASTSGARSAAAERAARRRTRRARRARPERVRGSTGHCPTARGPSRTRPDPTGRRLSRRRRPRAARRRATSSAASTRATAAGSPGRSPWEGSVPGQSSWTGTLVAPARRAESAGHDDAVGVGPHRDPLRTGRRLVAGVEGAQEVAVGGELHARRRGRCRRRRGRAGPSRCRGAGEPSVTTPAGLLVAAVVGDPGARHHPAGGVADDVDRGRAVGQQRVDPLTQGLRLLVEVAGAVTDHGYDDHVAAGSPRRRSPGAPGRRGRRRTR